MVRRLAALRGIIKLKSVGEAYLSALVPRLHIAQKFWIGADEREALAAVYRERRIQQKQRRVIALQLIDLRLLKLVAARP